MNSRIIRLVSSMERAVATVGIAQAPVSLYNILWTASCRIGGEQCGGTVNAIRVSLHSLQTGRWSAFIGWSWWSVSGATCSPNPSTSVESLATLVVALYASLVDTVSKIVHLFLHA